MRVFKSSLIISSFLFFLTASAQNSDQLSGRIVDEANHSMPYVSLKIGSSTSSMTNPDGDFSLRIPAGTTGQIIVSCIGYETQYIPIQQLSNPVTIKMKSVVSRLQEVKIFALNGEAIIRKAMRNITQNYPVTAFESTGFYREVAKIDDNYLSFAEASLQILNPGYQHIKEKDRIIINRERNLKRVGDSAVDNPFHAAVKGVPYVVLANDLLAFLQRPLLMLLGYHFQKTNEMISLRYSMNGDK
ncbi:carboxypeptidase-like regulatory domain-containing protein [Pedobacter hiemivivus]|uniref:Carboxypeptidase-like regulatory domain-containing protein n=1 Tax=Pedobacter hiemivivus TaxID=2530454 RepID=A0A4R0N5U2_9SPHI|nr:carboxypeptidase-like regulatory domain-containing protein [Pedobacter hiemivivus]TCC94713.1 hypothetical protein EZ444_17100 [Pedobacter hiemivivus]